MWTLKELERLDSLLEEVTVDSFCNEEEIKVINRSEIALANLRNAVFVPKHTFPVVMIHLN